MKVVIAMDSFKGSLTTLASAMALQNAAKNLSDTAEQLFRVIKCVKMKGDTL